MPVVTLDDLFGRGGRKIGTPRLELPTSVVTHNSLDAMEFGNFADDSPRFRRIAVENAPVVEPRVAEPDPIDFTTASTADIKAWQIKARAVKEAKDNAPAYTNWEKLARDMFYSYLTHDRPEIVDPCDPGVELHKRIMPKMMLTDEHAKARNMTRDDATMAAVATMAAAKVLKEILGEELAEQAQESEEYQQLVNQVMGHMGDLDDLRQQAADKHQAGQAIPQALRDAIKQAVAAKQAAQAGAAAAAQSATPMSAKAMEAIEAAAAAGQDAAEAAGNLPSFGAGFGQGEPSYESPEQALSIAEAWANNPQLRQMAELFGRLDKDIRFHRSNRVIGGNDEIVDVQFGDNLSRVLPCEWGLFADEDTELDFLARYASGDLLQFSTVGEENAGRGPIILVLDGSGSMSGASNIWARAVAMCLLHIARLEKRDFCAIEFSGGNEFAQWTMYARQQLKADVVLDMASHFFGGGTTPIVGVAAAAKFMQDAPEFKKADCVMIGDGEAGFGPEDKRLRDQMMEMGVRFFGMGIGGSFGYLENYCEIVVPIHEFELTDPSAATAMLATHVT